MAVKSPFLLIGLLALVAPCYLQAGRCTMSPWSLKDMANSPVLLVGRVISVSPRASKSNLAKRGSMAQVEVLRLAERPGTSSAAPTGVIQLRLIDRDALDISCPVSSLQIGQVLLLPLSGKAKPDAEPWQFMQGSGYYRTTLLTAEMAEPPLSGVDSRLFIVRELVNSFRNGRPLSLLAASFLIAHQGYYVEPDLPNRLKATIPLDDARWAQILGSLLLTFPGRTLTLADLQVDEPQQYWTRSQSPFRLAQLAFRHLPGRAIAETLVWQTLLADLPGLTDRGQYSPALQVAADYLTRYRNDAVFIADVKAALNQDRFGSSVVALALVEKGQKDCLPEALVRSLKVLQRPADDERDLDAALLLVRRYGSSTQRQDLRSIAIALKKTNPTYTGYLLRSSRGAEWPERSIFP